MQLKFQMNALIIANDKHKVNEEILAVERKIFNNKL